MTDLTLALLVLFLVMLFAPQSALARSLHRTLVEPLARLLNGGPLKVLFAIVVLFAAAAFAVSAPELFVLMGVADATAYLDAVVISTVVGAIAAFSIRGVAGAQTLRQAIGRLASRRSGRGQGITRAMRPRRPRRRTADPDTGLVGAWACTWVPAI